MNQILDTPYIEKACIPQHRIQNTEHRFKTSKLKLHNPELQKRHVTRSRGVFSENPKVPAGASWAAKSFGKAKEMSIFGDMKKPSSFPAHMHLF